MARQGKKVTYTKKSSRQMNAMFPKEKVVEYEFSDGKKFYKKGKYA